MDVPQATWRSLRRVGGDSASGTADGRGESLMGLHADRRRAEERRPSGQPVDDRPDPESGWRATRTRATDLVADVSAGALGRDRGRRFLHDRGLDVAWVGDVLHAV